MNLLQETLNLLINRPAWITLISIARDTGLGEDWLALLQKRQISDPGVIKIEKLNAYLKEKVNERR